MKAFYSDDLARLYCADVLKWALWYRGEIEAGRAQSFHAIVTDSPYGLGALPPIDELLKAWLADEEYNTGCGFMSTHWDVVPSPKIWRALLDICYPGAYLFTFSGTRTADLLGIACRLGGWEPFDRIASFAWVQAQGFVKNTNIGKMLDKEAGAEREVVGKYQLPNGQEWNLQQAQNDDGDHASGAFTASGTRTLDVTAPATDLAKTFDGYGNAISPKHEPILLFRKPREGRTFAQCAREFGSGALNVDECRVGTNWDTDPTRRGWQGGNATNSQSMFGRAGSERVSQPNTSGRWPPNVAFSHIAPTNICPTCQGDGCDECGGVGMTGGCRRVGARRVKGSNAHFINTQASDEKMPGVYSGGLKRHEKGVVGHADADGLETVDDWQCHESCPILALDEMAGERKSGGKSGITYQQAQLGMYTPGDIQTSSHYGSTGSASRFYPNHDWSYEIAERLAGETPYLYQAKASRGERDAGLGGFPETTECLTSLKGIESVRRCPEHDASIPSGSNYYSCGCRIIKHNTSQRQPQRNTGPCVKPLSLTKWLATLCRPPEQFKPRIAIPFCGTGSEAIGAILASGWAEIHAIERELEYVEIAAARIAWWSKWVKLTGKDDPKEIRALAETAEAREAWQDGERQRSIFDILQP